MDIKAFHEDRSKTTGEKRLKARIWAVLLAGAVLLVAAAGCSQETGSGEEPAGANSGLVTTPVSMAAEKVKAEDLDSSWDLDATTQITLSGASAAVSGEGATAAGGTVTITKAGTYVVSGTLTDGQIVVDAGEGDLVRLVLNGADITSLSGAPIYAPSADKLVVILADGTRNTVTDGGQNFAYASLADAEPDAAVFSKSDLTLSGTGLLTVNAGFNNGIGTKDDLVIVSGSYTINAVSHGIRGRDSLVVLDGDFRVTAGNDGLQSNNNEDPKKGWIFLEGGVFNIASVHDGIQAETALSVTGGEYTIVSGGGSGVPSSFDTLDSYKGLKAGGDLMVSGGSFLIDSADDSVHANGSIAVSGGDFVLSSGGDGVHADADLSISNGNIVVKKSYEGLEGATVNIGGGTIDITSSDDGINAAGGNDGGLGGRFGKDSFGSSGTCYIKISGGDIAINAGGDGLDSNGDITVTGGNIVSIINSTADNEGVDCDGTFTVTGGTLIYGGTGAGAAPGQSSTQSYVFINGGVSSNTEVSVQKDGVTLISFTPSADCRYLALSSPEIVSGKSYDVYSGQGLISTVTAGTGVTGGMGGGPGGIGQRPMDPGSVPEGFDPGAVPERPARGESPGGMGQRSEGPAGISG